MKITSTKTDEQNLVLTLLVEAADYAEARRKKLAQMQRQADMPGFRKGHVPASLVEKLYGQNALGDAVNTVVSEALQDYIKTEELDIIGEPLPCEDTPEQEWKAGNDFTFTFDVALTPKVDFTLSKEDVIPFYNINVTETEKKKLVEMYRKQEESIAKASAENGNEAAAAATDEELAQRAADQLSAEYKQAAEFRFDKDARALCVEKAALTLPEKFLRRYLIAANEGKFTAEQIDKDFEGFLADYRWQTVMGYLIKKYDIKLEEADFMEEAKNFARYQYSMYGIMDAPEDAIENFAKNILQDEGNFQRIVENVQLRKTIAAVKENVTVKAKKISLDKFKELQ